MQWLKKSVVGKALMTSGILCLATLSVSSVYSQPVSSVSGKNYSLMGTVNAVSSKALSVSGSDGVIDFDPSTASKIESKGYIALSLNDIRVGDQVIVQGTEEDGRIILKRIIDMSWTSDRQIAVVPSETASSTEEVATTTQDIASSTESSAPSTGNTDLIVSEVVVSSESETASTTSEMNATSTDATTTPASDENASTTNSDTMSDEPVATPSVENND